MLKPRFLVLILSFLFTCLAAQEQSDRSALIVLDVQEQFTVHAMDSLASAGLIGAINEVIVTARPMDILFVTANIRLLSISFKGIKTESAEHLELDGRLYRKKNDLIFDKGESSAFSVQELNEYLADNNINHIYLVGIYLGECITGSAIDGISKGYKITVITDAVAAKKPSKFEKYLEEIKSGGVEVISLEDFTQRVEG